MGWKSTIDITRDEAMREIINQMVTLNDKTNEELADMLYSYGFGEDSKLKWYGHNFNIKN